MERSQILQTKQFLDGQPVVLDLPLSCIIKRIVIDLYGSIQCTFSGSPVAYPTNIMDILLTNISVNLGSGRTVKSIRPATAQLFNLLAYKQPRVRRATTGAAAYSLPKSIDVDAAFTYPTSTQYASFIESLIMNFEVPESIALNGAACYLNLFKETQANITFQCGTASGLEGTGVSVTYANANIFIDTTIITVNDSANKEKLDFRETVKRETISAQTNNQLIKLPTGQKLIGLGILVESNISSAGSVESFKNLNNRALKELRVFKNTDQIERSIDFLRQQFENRVKYGINAPFASNVSPFDGYIYINFLENRDLSTALDLRTSKGIADAYLEITTAAARAAAPFITYPLTISVHIYELAEVPKPM